MSGLFDSEDEFFFFLGKRFILVNSYVRYFSCYVRYPRRNKLFDSRRTMRTSNRLQPRQTADSCQVTVFHVCSLRSAIGTSQAHNHKPPTTVTQPCRPSPPTSTEDHSQRHKDPLHLLAHPKVHRLRSLWHAADRESEGSLVMRTPSRRKTCASGTYRGGRTHKLCSTSFRTKATFSFMQWLPQPQVVRPDFPPRKAMEARARDGLWSVRRRNVSAVPSPLLFPSRRAPSFFF